MSKNPPPPAPKKEVITPHHEILAVELAEESDEERNYGEVRLWLTARDPHCLFAYWDFRPDEHRAAVGKDGRARFFLRIFHDRDREVSSVEIEPGAGHTFISDRLPDTGHVAELGFFTSGIWCFIARSDIARTPPAFPPEHETVIFATIPADISLAKLRGLLAASALPGESLAMTAARLQHDARNHGEWTPEHERLLAEILGASAGTPTASSANSFTLTVRQKLAATAHAALPGVPVPAAKVGGAPSSPGASWSSRG